MFVSGIMNCLSLMVKLRMPLLAHKQGSGTM
jgi:hypothetical protein